MPGPSIAVIVLNWNDARYLPRCLRSVLEQPVAPDEIVVVDDQSTDDSVGIIRSMVSEHAHAKVIVNPVNLGTNGALNEGLRHVTSEYVLFLAANDYILPGIFSRAKKCLARSPDIGLWSAMAWMIDEQDRILRLHPSAIVSLEDAVFTPQECVKLAYRFGNWFTGTTLIYHREALAVAGGFDPAYGGLSDLLTALVVASSRGAAYSPRPFGAMRVHADGFLFKTLKDSVKIEAMLAKLAACGPQWSPTLFTHRFLERTALRFRFAAVRASDGVKDKQMIGNVRTWKSIALHAVDLIVPRTWARTRIALAFLVLRPFDVLPTIWYRFVYWGIVLRRVRSRRDSIEN